MVDRLKLAFDEASKLSEADQAAFAEFLLAELADERRWRESLAKTQDLLAELSDEARTR